MGTYMGQNYDPSTPIAADAYAKAKAWDMRSTAARLMLRHNGNKSGPWMTDFRMRAEWEASRHFRMTEYVRR